MMVYLYKSLIFVLLLFNNSSVDTQKKTFTFVQLCDTQLGFNVDSYENDISAFKMAVTQINALNPDFVVICGDLVNNACDSTYSDFIKIKQQFKMPCYVAPGNHDVGNIPNDTSLRYYRKVLGQDYYDFQFNGFSFIVTNSQLWKYSIGDESEKHELWFKETLKKHRAKAQSVFVIGHHPLYTQKPEEDENYFNLPPAKRMELLNLFQENNVIAYLSGHSHQKIIMKFKNTQLVTGETTSRNFDKRPLGFRLWEVKSGNAEHQFIALQPSEINI